MTYPEGIITRPVEAGSALAVTDGRALTVETITVASRALIHLTTGTRLEKVTSAKASPLKGESLYWVTACTDRSGEYLDADTREIIILGEDEHTHTYTTTLRVLDEDGDVLGTYEIGPYPVPTPETPFAYLDLDSLQVVDVTTGTAIPIPESWTQIVADAVQAAADVQAGLEQLAPSLADIADLKTKTTTGYLAPEKVAPLESGKLPEANVPDRLTEPALSATIAESIRAFEVAARFGQAYWDATFAAPADAPTITLETANPISGGVTIREKRTGGEGSSTPVDMAGDTHFRYDGTPSLGPSPSGGTSFVTGPLLPEGNAQNAGYLARYETITERANAELVVKLRAIGTGVKLRVIVDGQWCTLRAQEYTGLTVGNDYFLRLVFPSPKKRHIVIETVGNLVGFGGVIVPSGQSVSRPAAPIKRRVVIGGDSYTGGAQDVNRLETYALMLAKLLGADSVWNFGIGGSGWATAPEFQTRVAAMLAAKPDVVIWLGSQNDGSKTDTYAKALTTLQSFAGVAEVYVAGPSWTGTANNNVRAAAIEAGVKFFDGAAAQWVTDADKYPADQNHINHGGHQKIARGFYGAIRASIPLLGAVAVATPSGPTAPGQVTGLSAIPGGGQVALSWAAPGNGGSAITDYVIEYKLASDSIWTTFADGTSTALSATVTGLANGSAYTFRVTAVNAQGTGTPSAAAAATPVAPLLPFVDEFDRPDSTTSAGSEYTATTGSVWGITAGKAYTVSGSSNNYLVRECQTANVDIETTLGSASWRGSGQGIAFRVVDNANGWHVNFGSNNTSGSVIEVRKRVGGASQLVHSIAVRPAVGDTIRVVVNGDTITVYQNGTQIGTYTGLGSDLATATKHGLWTLGVNAEATFTRLDMKAVS